jgi:outer membrane immunogenic protein
MRKFLMPAAAALVVAAPALAADITSPQPPPPAYPPPPPLFTWTGVYLGGQIGWGWDTDTLTVLPAGFSTSFSPSGVVGGAHVGYNQQFNQFVAGVEGDVEGTSIDETFSPGIAFFRTKIPAQGSIRARLGVAFDRALLYATGGAEFAGFDTSVAGPGLFPNQSSHTEAGWTIGGGIEYAITNNWSVMAEYRFADFGRFTDVTPSTFGFVSAVNHHETENTVRAGFSYRFSPFGLTGY